MHFCFLDIWNSSVAHAKIAKCNLIYLYTVGQRQSIFDDKSFMTAAHFQFQCRSWKIFFFA